MAMMTGGKYLIDTATKFIFDEEAKANLYHVLEFDQQNTFFLVEEYFLPSKQHFP